MKVAGWILFGAGMLIMALVSGVVPIVFGFLLAMAGIIMIYPKKDTPSKKTPPKVEPVSNYTDVVYLKNGSIIKGTIVEQTPGTQVKIQTRDGNMFVYDFSTIEKITKEKSLNP
jgi:hypothetical protein